MAISTVSTLSQSRRAQGASLCVAGTVYDIAQDDEFATDSTLSTSPAAVPVAQTLSPKITWSTQFNWGGGAFYNNGGTDDAYYEDPTLAPALNPFTLTNGALGITASPLAQPTTPPDGIARHWASGELTGPPITYGYFEIDAKLPTLQGFWPALWLHPINGGSFLNGATAAEYDIAEIFGNASPERDRPADGNLVLRSKHCKVHPKPRLHCRQRISQLRASVDLVGCDILRGSGAVDADVAKPHHGRGERPNNVTGFREKHVGARTRVDNASDDVPHLLPRISGHQDVVLTECGPDLGRGPLPTEDLCHHPVAVRRFGLLQKLFEIRLNRTLGEIE